LKERPGQAVTRARERAPWLDHLVRAVGRYQADTGDRLAASVTYFGFLSFFPLLSLSVAVLSLVLGPDAKGAVIDQVNAYAPGLAGQLDLEALLDTRPRDEDEPRGGAAVLAGVASLAGLLYAGLGWVDALREALRAMWHQNVLEGNLVAKKLKDVGILAGLGLTLVLTIGVSAAAGAFTGFFLGLVGLEGSLPATVLLKGVGTALALLTSTLLFLYLFLRLPRLTTPWRRLVRGAVLAAVLFEVLKRVGAIYIDRTTGNPVYGAFAVAVGLLVWINLVSRMLLLCAAWTATAPYDSDVAPSGTADPESARRAGIPVELADDAEPPAPAGSAPAVLPGEAATRTVARAGAAAISVGLAGVALYALRTLRGALRRR
jgi:membrane protein